MQTITLPKTRPQQKTASSLWPNIVSPTQSSTRTKLSISNAFIQITFSYLVYHLLESRPPVTVSLSLRKTLLEAILSPLSLVLSLVLQRFLLLTLSLSKPGHHQISASAQLQPTNPLSKPIFTLRDLRHR